MPDLWAVGETTSWCLRAQAFRRVPVGARAREVELRKLQHQRPELGQLVPAPNLDQPGSCRESWARPARSAPCLLPGQTMP